MARKKKAFFKASRVVISVSAGDAMTPDYTQMDIDNATLVVMRNWVRAGAGALGQWGSLKRVGKRNDASMTADFTPQFGDVGLNQLVITTVEIDGGKLKPNTYRSNVFEVVA
jgi:hypothetical protein